MVVKIFQLSKLPDTGVRMSDYFFNSDVKVVYVDSLEEATCVELEGIDTVHFDNKFKKMVDDLKLIYDDSYESKPIVFCYLHEKFPYDIFVDKMNLLIEKLNLNLFNFYFFDSSMLCSNKYRFNKIPLELILRSFSRWTSLKNFNFIENKEFKFCLLINKVKTTREIVFEKVLNAYHKDSFSLKKDSIITYNETPNDDFLEFLYEEKKRNEPHNSDWYDETHSFYRKSIFSIVCESENYEWLNLDILNKKSLQYESQISEKSILPFFNKNFSFLIVDSHHYHELINLGFDFSYLDFFGIKYKTNNISENLKNVTMFTEKIKDMSFHECLSFKEKYNSILENNYKVAYNLYNGDISDSTKKWLLDNKLAVEE